MGYRRPPLHTCGAAFMEIADKAYTNALHLNGPLGSVTKNLARLASPACPLVYALEYQILIMFSFFDDRIFALESQVEAIFPPSRYAFDKIDEFVRAAEILPGKFDAAVNNFPTVIHQVSFLDWALLHAISCLNFFISRLTEWENTIEKEIMMDMNSSERSNEPEVLQESASQKTETQNLDHVETKEVAGRREGFTYKDALEKEVKVTKATYKDALEKGTKKEENGEGRSKTRAEKNSSEGRTMTKEKIEKKKKVRTEEESEDMEGDEILETESSWLMKLGRYGKQSSFSCSASFKW
ncbi:uncharacterized protein LOC110629015 [Manihot esculenta]|uniref:Uncharacterized protein n=4 Tax=Manihot esculenta TaxID=3983 RepID=A0ACB7GI61_MANES|nr:uncharacterized protein LOC110629015 [Manihot esculenta]KAG8640006.1 hypothetical protein MANES_13G017400v8 [Manihot esculenta]KAG8640007.1 hypothetical protein MANES_13G017400v8 [Manihot esculenta]KAG8640008.1 hypothetical protein MANES_13G017400v8 [Manihot esculenta]KAG8640009.1 hypothetical protein MANES_13G017400v8 [Manihot esculenta]